MKTTYNTFLKETLAATTEAIKKVNLPYLEVSERKTMKGGTLYRGIMIKANHPDAPYASAFYLEEAFRNYKKMPYDLEKFATDLVVQFLMDYDYITSCMADKF